MSLDLNPRHNANPAPAQKHRSCSQGLDVRETPPPCGEGKVFSLDIPFYRTRPACTFVIYGAALNFAKLKHALSPQHSSTTLLLLLRNYGQHNHCFITRASGRTSLFRQHIRQWRLHPLQMVGEQRLPPTWTQGNGFFEHDQLPNFRNTYNCWYLHLFCLSKRLWWARIHQELQRSQQFSDKPARSRSLVDSFHLFQCHGLQRTQIDYFWRALPAD